MCTQLQVIHWDVNHAANSNVGPSHRARHDSEMQQYNTRGVW